MGLRQTKAHNISKHAYLTKFSNIKLQCANMRHILSWRMSTCFSCFLLAIGIMKKKYFVFIKTTYSSRYSFVIPGTLSIPWLKWRNELSILIWCSVYSVPWLESCLLQLGYHFCRFVIFSSVLWRLQIILNNLKMFGYYGRHSNAFIFLTWLTSLLHSHTHTLELSLAHSFRWLSSVHGCQLPYQRTIVGLFENVCLKKLFRNFWLCRKFYLLISIFTKFVKNTKYFM